MFRTMPLSSIRTRKFRTRCGHDLPDRRVVAHLGIRQGDERLMNQRNTFLDAVARIGGLLFVICVGIVMMFIFSMIIADLTRKRKEENARRKNDVRYVHELVQNIDKPESPNNDQQFFNNIERARSDFN